MHFESALAIFFCICLLNKGSKVKTNKWDYIKLKSFCPAKKKKKKETKKKTKVINKMKRQSIEWEKIFEKYLSCNGLISKINTELIQQQKTNNQMKNGQMTFLPKEYIELTNRLMKRCSTSPLRKSKT